MVRPQPLLEIGEDTLQHPHWKLVERVAASHGFQSSTRLRDFLFYVAMCALKDAPGEATEQHIGIHVFQRSPGYNSSDDSIVRTHARSLRQKLREYFHGEGIDEEIVIEIPKGRYLPIFIPRAGVPLPPIVDLPKFDPPAPVLSAGRRSWHLPAALLLFCIAAAAIGAWALHARSRSTAPTAIERFWGPFFAGNDSLVIYSNALFVGDAKTGLRYAPASPSPPEAVTADTVDTYTGIGEVGSVYELTRLFDSHQASFTLKRSMLVGWDEAKLKNLVFIGSVAENPALRVLPDNMDFTLQAGNGFSGIANRHPHAGESLIYSRAERPLERDYAIIALLPGLVPGRRTLVFSGLMTLGTQAAIEFACRPDSLQQLVRAASAPDGTLRPFEAIVETTLGGGVPLSTRLVTLHVH